MGSLKLARYPHAGGFLNGDAKPVIKGIPKFIRALMVTVVGAFGLLIVVDSFSPGTIHTFLPASDCQDSSNNDGKQVRDVLHARLKIPKEDWNDLRAALREFAARYRLAFVDQSHEDSGSVFQLQVCGDDGLKLVVTDFRWAVERIVPIHKGHGVGFTLYQKKSLTDQPAVARDLVATLRARWPDDLEFVNTSDHSIPAPSELELPAKPGE